MGTSSIVVLFPGGIVRHGTYQNTSDVCFSDLWQHSDAAWSFRDGKEFHLPPHHPERSSDDLPVESVTIYCDYGDGFWWTGTATLDTLITGFEPP